ncbi:hypothetical protein MXB_1172 [Myxobolus squamalis]|nr:hypothetical protein MXB_1172 [Myxobolus squamalis]
MINYCNDYPVKLGRPGITLHSYETILNYKVKSFRGRGPNQQTWAICIIYTSFIPEKGYCEIIPNKRAETLIRIIMDIVREYSTIHAGILRRYNRIPDLSYNHRCIFHKSNFVCVESGEDTQNLESFNNKLKL